MQVHKIGNISVPCLSLFLSFNLSFLFSRMHGIYSNSKYTSLTLTHLLFYYWKREGDKRRETERKKSVWCVCVCVRATSISFVWYKAPTSSPPTTHLTDCERVRTLSLSLFLFLLCSSLYTMFCMSLHFQGVYFLHCNSFSIFYQNLNKNMRNTLKW